MAGRAPRSTGEPKLTIPPKVELRYTLPTRQWPGSVRLLAFPVGFALGPVFIVLRGEPITGVVALFCLLAGGLAMASGLLVLLLLRLRRGPDFGIGDAGVWLRPSPWRRTAVFVPYGRLRTIEVEPLRDRGSFLIGALIRLDTVDGLIPRRPRFVACRRSGYESLANATASIHLLTGGSDVT